VADILDMRAKKTLIERIKLRLSLSKKEVFLRADFKDLGGYDQVGRALKTLIDQGLMVRLGQGLFARARKNRITGTPTIAVAGGFKRAVEIALDRLGVVWTYNKATEDYNRGLSNQIPANLVYRVKTHFTRKLYLGKLKAEFEYSSTLYA